MVVAVVVVVEVVVVVLSRPQVAAISLTAVPHRKNKFHLTLSDILFVAMCGNRVSHMIITLINCLA